MSGGAVGIFAGAPEWANGSERIRFTIALSNVAADRLTGRVRKTGEENWNYVDDESVQRAGYKDLYEFWTVALSEPMEPSAFVHMLYMFYMDPSLKNKDIERHLSKSMDLALTMNESWFIFPRVGGVLLRPRDAAEWMLSMPKERHLVPASLAAFLRESRNTLVEAPAAQKAFVSTGLPGRPAKSKDLIATEFERRAAAGVVLASVRDEARHLARWLRDEHPNMPAATAKTIENNIRDRHRVLRPPK